MQTEKYTNKLQVEQQSTNFCIFTNATLTSNGISTTDGVTLSQAGRVKKSIRHAPALYKAFNKHKPHGTEVVNIYDNELDKVNCGRLKVEFNKGIAAVQMAAMKNRKEFCKITNVYKKTPNIPPQMVIVGEKDFENLKQLLHDASAHFKRVADQGSAESQAALIIADLMGDDDKEEPKPKRKAKRKRSVSPSPAKKKFTVPECEKHSCR